MIHRILLPLVFLCINITVAQNCNLVFEGKVEDFHEKSFLNNAVVHIKNLKRYTTTDENGYFKFSDICEDQILEIEISHIACENKKISLTITENTYKLFLLEHHTEDLDEVHVSSTERNTATKQTTSIKTSTLENYSSGNLGDALKEVSGVSSLNTGSSIVKPVINGMHSSRVSVLVDGVRLQDHDWGVEHAPNVDVNYANNITVYKGANALEFSGDAIGGVVTIEPKHVILKDTLFASTIVTQETNGRLFSVNTKVHKYTQNGWYGSAYGTFKKSGDVETPDYFLTNTGAQSSSLTLQTGLKKFEYGFDIMLSQVKNDIGILSASHLGNIEDLVIALEADEPLIIDDFSFDINNPKQKVTHQIAKLAGYKRFKGLGRLDVFYTFQKNRRLEFDKRIGENKFKPASDLALKTHTLNSIFKFDANTNKVFKVGFNLQYQNNFADPATDVRRLIPDYDKYDLALFAISNINLSDFLIDFGVRYDFNYYNSKKFYIKSRWESLGYDQNFANFVINEQGNQYLTNPVFSYHNLALSAGINYSFNNYQSIAFSYGLSNRAPNPSELFSEGLHHSASRIEIGSLYLNQEQSNRFGLTYRYNNKALNFNAEGYANFINDYIFIAPTGTEKTTRGAFPVYNYQQTNAAIYGVDTNLNYNFIKNVIYNNKSSFIIGDDLTNNTPLIDIPPFQITNSITYRNEEIKNIYLTFENIYVSKQNRYPDNNFYTFLPVRQEEVLVDISSTPKAYSIFNIKTGASFTINKTKFSLNFSVNNLLNTKYRNYLNRLRFYSDELGRNFKAQLIINY